MASPLADCPDLNWSACGPRRELLPFYASVFAVDFTLLASSVPEELVMGIHGVGSLLLVIARRLNPVQMVLGFTGRLTIVVLAKLSALAQIYGGGSGNLNAWPPSPEVKLLCLGSLFLLDGLDLLDALSLRGHGEEARPTPSSRAEPMATRR